MFKLATTNTYKRKINIEVPLDMGKTEKSSFIMEFRRLSVSEIKELVEEAKDKELDDEAMINRYAMDWEGIVDDEGKEVPFTPTNLSQAMDISYVRKGIMKAFMEDVFGKEVVRKNS